MVGTRGRRHRVAALLVAAGMVLAAAACGGDDSGSDDGAGDTTTAAPGTTSAATTASTTAPDAASTTVGGATTDPAATTGPAASGEWVATVAGCEARGVTDPADRSAERQVARCEPGTPAPQPLPERVKLTVSSSASLEFMSPVLLAQSLGEFEKENLEVEVVPVSYADAVPQLAQGTIDAAVGGIDLSLFNMGNQGLQVRAVLGNYYPPYAGDYDVAQTGLWCRRDAFTDPADPDPMETEELVWASSVGKGAGSIYYATLELQKRAPEFDISPVEVQQIPAAEVLTAMENDAVDCGILLDPVWLSIAEDPDYVLMATQTPGEPLGQISFGKFLLEERPDVGDAFVRAYLRTVSTYYDGDYHADDEVMNEIAEQTGVEVGKMTQVPSLVFDWEIREGTTTGMQQLFIDAGVISQFDTPVPEEQMVDRSFYLRAVGAA